MRLPDRDTTLYYADTTRLPRLGVRRTLWEGGSCRLGLFDTELEAWQDGLDVLENYRNRWADAARLAQRQVDDADMWLREYRRNLSTRMESSDEQQDSSASTAGCA